MKQFSSPMLNVAVEAGQIIKISLVTMEEDSSFHRDLWLVVKSYEEGLITIQGEDLEIMSLWERNEDELSETEER